MYHHQVQFHCMFHTDVHIPYFLEPVSPSNKHGINIVLESDKHYPQINATANYICGCWLDRVYILMHENMAKAHTCTYYIVGL